MRAKKRPGARLEVAARDIYTLVKSEFTLWAEHHAPRESRDPLDPLTELLFERGRDYQEDVSSQRWPDIEVVSFPTARESFDWTLGQMAQGTPALRRVHLLVGRERLSGQPDLLERDNSHRSTFGRYHYAVRAVKLARHVGDHDIAQELFYNHLVGTVQGYTPPQVFIINGDGQEQAFDHDPEGVAALIERARGIIGDETRPRPFWNGSQFPWKNYANRRAAAAKDVSQVTDVGGKRALALEAIGVRTVRQLAQASIGDLKEVRGVGLKRAKKWQDAARALDSGKPIRRARPALPKARTLVFFDLEGTTDPLGRPDELRKTTYLFGCLLHKPGGGDDQYFHFVAGEPAKEEETFLEFCRWFETLGDARLVHWAPYEKTELNRLFDLYPAALRHRERVMASLRDLYRVLTNAWTMPTRGHGLKVVARWLRFSWRHRDVDAGTSIVYYMKYVEDPKAHSELLAKVIDYNEDDVRATAVAYDWLASGTGRRPPPKRRKARAPRRAKAR